MEDIVKEPEQAPVAPTKKRGWPKGKPRKIVVPVLDASGKLQELETKPKRRRRRKNVVGVTVGKDFYPCYSAQWEDSGNFLKAVADGSEVWIPIDRTKPIKVKGFSLPPLVRHGSSWITYTNSAKPGDSTFQTYLSSQTPTPTVAASGPRVVEPSEHVNIPPEREAYVRRVAAMRNRQLDNLMATPTTEG